MRLQVYLSCLSVMSLCSTSCLLVLSASFSMHVSVCLHLSCLCFCLCLLVLFVGLLFGLSVPFRTTKDGDAAPGGARGSTTSSAQTSDLMEDGCERKSRPGLPVVWSSGARRPKPEVCQHREVSGSGLTQHTQTPPHTCTHTCARVRQNVGHFPPRP